MTVLNIKDKVKNNKLNLSGLNLTEIPVKEIAPLKVTHLDLSNNKISSTDNVFSSLTSLVKLDLSNNQIKSVAGDIGSLQKLAHLSLANNKIKDLPKGVSKLKQLKHLNLSNNPLKAELADAVGPSQNNAQFQSAAVNVIQYFKDNKSDSKKQDDKQNKKKDKKNIKASPNGVQNDKSKNKTKPKKKSSFVSKVFGFFGMLISYTLLLVVLSGLSLYGLSYYDKRAYGNVKAKILPYWVSATSNLDPQVAAKVNYYLQQAGTNFDLAVQTSIEASIKSYKWVKANPTVQQSVKNLNSAWQSLWDSIFKKGKST
ncbi:Leucine-rich repeat,Leucine-rich repeat domain, L domain-like,Leucine-rich repeat, typical subtype [Cinara cedri]|uniref:Leucine-rich repeat,Leucine-rich repeat domain, L domain-like,Leucine-rich repeat, typical subtype n=1 Tax=Cinara cedri TaxID=506608 RepID=A0A5E4NT24_9HEMI|nr:Leucine-rich repeat,Leucine-rich repeat domain, L domain-like,Leucine-rich repeat, typical subtype [Cinara cedri]